MKLSETERKRRIALSQRLASQARELLNNQLDLSILLALEATKQMDTAEARNALLNCVLYNPRLAAFMYGVKHWAVRSVAFSPDGKILASGSGAKTIMLWNVTDPYSPLPLGDAVSGHKGPVLSVVFSPDGNTLASQSLDYFGTSGSWNKTIILWNVTDPYLPILMSEWHYITQSTETGVAISPDGKILASKDEDSKVSLWDVTDLRAPKQLSEPPSKYEQWARSAVFIGNVALSPDGRMRASGERDNTIRLLDMTTPGHPEQLGEPLIGHTNEVESIAFNSDNKTLASTSGEQYIILWDLTPRSPLQLGEPFPSQTYRLQSLAYSPDGKMLAGGNDGHTITLWDVNDPRSPIPVGKPLMGHTDGVQSVTFSPNGKVLASASKDETIILWDLTNPDSPKQMGKPLRGHDSVVWNVAFSPDEKMLASGSNDCSIILWDVTNPLWPIQMGKPLEGHTAPVEGVVFSPNGKILISLGACPVRLDMDSMYFTTGGAHYFILWDVTDPRSPVRLEMPLTFIGPVSAMESMTLSPDGKTLALGERGGTIFLWSVTQPLSPKLLVRLGKPFSGLPSIRSLAFSPDGKILAVGNADHTIILWGIMDPRSPVQLGKPLTGHNDWVIGLTFSPDGKMLASGSADGSIILWDVDLQSWVEKMCNRVGRNFTESEWQEYFPGEEYRITCSQWPAGI